MTLHPKSKRIFFADDDPDDHYLFMTAIKEFEDTIEVVQFYECGDLLDYLSQNDPPDYLFLDLNMPGNEELKCLTEIKMHEQYKNINVVIYTTANRGEIEQML